MKIDAKKTLQKLRGEETKRGRVTLYLDRDQFEQFKKICGDVAPSKVVDELISQFIESAKKTRK